MIYIIALYYTFANRAMTAVPIFVLSTKSLCRVVHVERRFHRNPPVNHIVPHPDIYTGVWCINLREFAKNFRCHFDPPCTVFRPRQEHYVHNTFIVFRRIRTITIIIYATPFFFFVCVVYFLLFRPSAGGGGAVTFSLTITAFIAVHNNNY